MATKAKASPTPQLDALVDTDPDLVDRIFDYVVGLLPEIAAKRGDITAALRAEFAGERVYIRRRGEDEPDEMAKRVLATFNGRNATEVARQLHIGRATVYRKLKQAGR